MKREKTIFLLVELLLGLLVAAAFLLLRSVDQRNKAEKVSVILEDSENVKWSGMKYGIRMAAQDQNAEVFFVSIDTDWTDDTLDALISEEIAGGADAVLTEEQLILEGPDQTAIGYALGRAVLEDYSGGIQGKTLGILAEDPDSEVTMLRNQGFLDAVQDSGADILWSCAEGEDRERIPAEEQPAVDLVAALDDESTREAGRLTAAQDLHGAILYGIGESMESIYYLDSGRAESLVIPDSFQTGYKALLSLSGSADSIGTADMPAYYVVNKDTLFTEENEGILLTLSQ
ncbi:MAG: hypothetical protein Q4B03_07925 [Lachnospiraceae bacterium]|nr:hypothetical protein [Lachnospiraceae bacterium]